MEQADVRKAVEAPVKELAWSSKNRAEPLGKTGELVEFLSKIGVETGDARYNDSNHKRPEHANPRAQQKPRTRPLLGGLCEHVTQVMRHGFAKRIELGVVHDNR